LHGRSTDRSRLGIGLPVQIREQDTPRLVRVLAPRFGRLGDGQMGDFRDGLPRPAIVRRGMARGIRNDNGIDPAAHGLFTAENKGRTS
jgi:hypothetical protein